MSIMELSSNIDEFLQATTFCHNLPQAIMTDSIKDLVGEATLWEKTSLMDPSNTASISEKDDTDLQKEEGNEQQHRKEKRFWSVRYGLAVMIHGSNLISTSQTFGLSIAIIAMVNNTGQSNQSNLYASTDAQVPVYEWSPEDQGFLLSSILYGIVIIIIPSGYVAGVLGGKKISGISLLISSVLILLIPLAADQGLPYLIFTRILQGLAQGMNLCALQALWPKWAPPLERTQMSNIGFSGTTSGNFIIILVGGFLCQSLGWPSIFYICGGIGCVYSIIWFFLVYDDPTNHPFISDSEKEYIVSSLAGQDSSPHWSMPIKAMMTSLPLWAIIFASFCRFWLVSNLTTSLPMLLNNIFDYSIEMNGFLSALPLLTSWITMIIGSQIAGLLLSKKILRLITVRKLFTFLGMFIPSLLVLAMPYVDFLTAIIFLILTSSISVLCFSGFIINSLDIAPRYTSFITGLTTLASSVSGVFSPTITGYFINQDPESGWKNVFLVSSGVNFLGMVFFLIFGKAEIQDWAKENTITRF
ncbi:sodium-dependent phosphate transport protein 3-like isoform X1 [Monodelphis domestica]|uniref:Probable small intestine urate exporter n=2 Tax=Monodelphis domestica TaxID=13616 RepID=F6VEU5_MONDO|nr:sodium-dependent phosphate transport protein 3-like isoform X1 [Monodelphis domestica]